MDLHKLYGPMQHGQHRIHCLLWANFCLKRPSWGKGTLAPLPQVKPMPGCRFYSDFNTDIALASPHWQVKADQSLRKGSWLAGSAVTKTAPYLSMTCSPPWPFTSLFHCPAPIPLHPSPSTPIKLRLVPKDIQYSYLVMWLGNWSFWTLTWGWNLHLG